MNYVLLNFKLNYEWRHLKFVIRNNFKSINLNFRVFLVNLSTFKF
jgi:hypothetical protein